MNRENYCSECQIEGSIFVTIRNYGQLCVICYELLDTIRHNQYWVKIQNDYLDSQIPE